MQTVCRLFSLFCKVCIKVAKAQLEDSIQEKAAHERKRLGMSVDIDTKSVSLVKTAGSKLSAAKKMAAGPQRLLKEADINVIYD